MTSPNEQRGLFSRLPEDRDYWLGLTDRIVDDGAEQLARFAGRGREWWSEIARFSVLLAAGAAAAVVAFFILVPIAEPVTVRPGAGDAYGLAPRDPLAMTLVNREAPPTIETLIALRNVEPVP